MQRRQLLAGLLAGTGALGVSRLGGAAGQIDLQEVAPGHFVHSGPHELAGPDNLGMISNVGCIVGEEAVAVVDTGGSALGGGLLRDAILSVTDRPIRYVIATHVHPDHVFGHAAFLGDQPTFVGHRRLPAALAARGPFYLERLQEALGGLAAGTEVVVPTLLVEDRLQIDLGDRLLDLQAHATAHTDNDFTVHDRVTGTFWSGDLVFVGRCPTLDGSLNGWLDVMDRLAQQDFPRVVPGHGPAAVPWPDALATQRRYLEGLREQVRAVIARGGTIEEAVRTVRPDVTEDLALLEETHPRNVTAAFAELEWE